MLKVTRRPQDPLHTVSNAQILEYTEQFRKSASPCLRKCLLHDPQWNSDALPLPLNLQKNDGQLVEPSPLRQAQAVPPSMTKQPEAEA